jgi:hypothetical protein
MLLLFTSWVYPRVSMLRSGQQLLLGALVLCVMMGVGFVWRLGARRRARERLLRSDAYDLSPTDFEHRVAVLLKDLGWEQVERSGGSGDGGVDLRATHQGKRYVISASGTNDMCSRSGCARCSAFASTPGPTWRCW